MTTHKICRECGSENIRVDAYGSWDSEQGDWVLASVYEETCCLTCDSSVDLVTVDEETELEIQMFGMIEDGDDFRLAVEGEAPQHYDVMVSANVNDTILTLHEIDELTKEAGDAEFASLQNLYPLASVIAHGIYSVGEAQTYGTEARNLAERQAQRLNAALGSTAYPDDQDSPQTLLRNALCDLRHFADHYGLTFGETDKDAHGIYRAEVQS